MYKLEDTEKVAGFFSSMEDTIIWSCLERTMWSIYVDNLREPRSAMALLGDFCFWAGEADEALAGFKPPFCEQEFVIMVPGNEAWETAVETVYGSRARQVRRFATKKEEHVWDLEKLETIVSMLPDEYELKIIDRDIYHYAQEHSWAREWVSQFPDYESYEKNGLGAAVLKDGIPVSGASSYSWYSRGIEIEIDTHEDFRRKGLATVCGARLILECEKRGLYPGWDAQNPWSLALAEKLGYHFDKEYTAYEIWGY